MSKLINEALEKVSNEEKKKELDEIVNEIEPIIRSMRTKKSNIGILTGKGFTEVDKYGTKVVCLTGGLNGCGKWEDYFNDLSKVMSKLENSGYHVWTINLDNDCLDDVFNLKIGIRRKKKGDE